MLTCVTATSSYDNYIVLVIKESDKAGLRYNGQSIAENLFETVEGSHTYIGKKKIVTFYKIP